MSAAQHLRPPATSALRPPALRPPSSTRSTAPQSAQHQPRSVADARAAGPEPRGGATSRQTGATTGEASTGNAPVRTAPPGARRLSGSTAADPPATGARGTRTLRRPQRVLKAGEGVGGSAAVGASVGLDRYTATLSASSRVPSTSTASLSASTLAPLRSSQALTTPRTRRVTPSSASTKPAEEFKKPLSPSTVRPRSRIVSSASTASAQSLSRSLSQSTSGALDSPRTVRPSRTLPKAPAGDTTPRKKPALGLGRPPQAGNETPRFARRSSGSTARTVSAASASSRTPLRSSSSAAPLSVSQTAMRPPPPPSIAASSRTLGASRRAAVPGSAIPVPGARALRRPESALSTASSNAPPGSETSLRSAAGSALRRPTPRTTAAVGGVRRASNASSTPSSRASQAGTAPQIALSPPPGAGAALPPLDASAFATPRKPASAVDAPSPEYATPAADLSTLSHFSHASFLSPLPPPASSSSTTSDLGASLSATPKPKQLTLLRPRARARPRESASLEELLRSGLLPGSSPAASSAGGGEGADEWELLLDEGSSRLMREEILAGDGGAAPAPAGQGQGQQGTPWRGRVVSLGMSARRRSVVGSPGSPADRALLSPPREGTPAQTPGEDRVLLLRQSTSEASALRRQLAALQGEVALLRSARTAGEEERDARAAALERELDAARAREDEAREEWERERREMEEEMAELASVVTAPAPAPAPAPVQGVDPARVAALEARQRALELDLGAERAIAARAAAAQAYRAVEAGARRERAEIKGELAALKALQQGLGLWVV